jgi:hypothetical protein
LCNSENSPKKVTAKPFSAAGNAVCEDKSSELKANLYYRQKSITFAPLYCIRSLQTRPSQRGK